MMYFPRSSSALTVLGILIGVLSVIALLAIGEGISIKAQERIEALAADDVTSQDWRDLEAWLEQDPVHRDTFDSLERMSGALRSLGDDPMLQALHDSAPDIAAVSGDAEIVPLRPRKVRRT